MTHATEPQAAAASPPKRRSGVSPTQRTLKRLRELGYLVQITEHWNAWARVRQDLFGFIDVLAISPDGELLGVQACCRGDVSKRATKIAEHPNTAAVRKAGIRIQVWGWGTLGGHGAKRIDCRVIDCS